MGSRNPDSVLLGEVHYLVDISTKVRWIASVYFAGMGEGLRTHG